MAHPPRPWRIGMIVPSSNLTMETELPRILRAREGVIPTERFTFHSSRMRMQHVTPEELAQRTGVPANTISSSFVPRRVLVLCSPRQ